MRHEKAYQELWDTLVPVSGQAETVQGELVRVIGRLASEYSRNGNGNWDRGFRMYTNFLWKHLRDKSCFDAQALQQIEEDIQAVRDCGSGKRGLDVEEEEEDVFDRLSDRVVEWCQQHPELLPHEKNPKLMR